MFQNQLAFHFTIIVYVHFDAFVYTQDKKYALGGFVIHLFTHPSPQSILIIFTFQWYGRVIVSQFVIPL